MKTGTIPFDLMDDEGDGGGISGQASLANQPLTP